MVWEIINQLFAWTEESAVQIDDPEQEAQLSDVSVTKTYLETYFDVAVSTGTTLSPRAINKNYSVDDGMNQ